MALMLADLPLQSRLKGALALNLPLLLSAALWALRAHSIEAEEGLDSSSRLLTNLIIGMHSDFHELWRANRNDPNNPATLDAQLIGDSYRLFLERLRELFRAEPLAMSQWYLVGKPLQLWSWNILTGAGDIYIYSLVQSLYQESQLALASYVGMKSAHPWLAAAALLGALSTATVERWRRAPALVITIALLYISAVYVATQAEPRYSIPLRPEMYILAVYFVYCLRKLARQRVENGET